MVRDYMELLQYLDSQEIVIACLPKLYVNHIRTKFFVYIGSSISAELSVDQREVTELVLEIVGVAEDNGLKLPREFGLLLKQVK